MTQTISITVQGRVQGVNFRSACKAKALELGLTGEVSNLSNGDVLIVATGKEVPLHALMDWCKKGPPLAKVTDVIAAILPVHAFTDFVIKR